MSRVNGDVYRLFCGTSQSSKKNIPEDRHAMAGNQENVFSLLSAKLFSEISPAKSGRLGPLLLVRTLRS